MKRLVLILPLLLLSACTGKLSRNEAAVMIQDSYMFNRWHEYVTVPVGGIEEEVDPVEQMLIQEGFLKLTQAPQPQPSTLWGWPAVAVEPEQRPEQKMLEVTAKGKKAMINTSAREELAALVGYVPAPRVRQWAFPVAKVKFVKVSGIKEEGENQATVEFVYAWDLDEMGQRLRKADPDNKELSKIAGEYIKTTATFEKYDDGWRLTNVTPR